MKMAETPSIATETQGSEVESKEGIASKSCFLFNCDHTCSLEPAQNLLKSIEEQVGFVISPIVQRYFDLHKMADMCEDIKKATDVMDFAIFVVHANESRLSINEENAGIGYAMFYRTLMEKTDGKVIIVIGGDENYKDQTEMQSRVLSRWAFRKVSSQFDAKLIDGRKSFIFSWDEKHRSIHEEAMVHFLDPQKQEVIFVPKKLPPVQTTTLEQLPAAETVKDYEDRLHSPKPLTHESQTANNEGMTCVFSPLKHSNPPLGATPETSKRYIGDSGEEPMEQDASHDFETIEMSDVIDIEPSYGDKTTSCPASLPYQKNAMQSSTVTPQNVAILYRNRSDLVFINDMFGEIVSSGVIPIKTMDPSDFETLLLNNPVRSCFIMLPAEKMKEFINLLCTAHRTVEKRVVVILCDSEKLSRVEEENVTDTIGQLLGQKGVILCLKTPRGELVLHTRLRYGNISYEKHDVLQRKKEWEATGYFTRDLQAEWKSFANVELKIYKNAEGVVHAVVNPEGQTAENLFKPASDLIGRFLPSGKNKDVLDVD